MRDWRGPCASSPASRTGCCSSSPPSSRASGARAGCALNQAEAVALIADEVCEAARDGRSYAEAEAAGYARARARATSPTACAELVRRVEVEALFADGSRLLVLHDPVDRERAAAARASPRSSGSPPTAPLTVVNEGDVPVGVTSHFHFFEVNRALRFERAAAWGMRLAIAPGAKVFFDPGEPREVFLVAVRRRARDPRPRRPRRRAARRARARSRPRSRCARERGYRGA